MGGPPSPRSQPPFWSPCAPEGPLSPCCLLPVPSAWLCPAVRGVAWAALTAGSVLSTISTRFPKLGLSAPWWTSCRNPLLKELGLGSLALALG